MGTFNLEPYHALLSGFINSQNYLVLIKGNTCLKGRASFVCRSSINEQEILF